MCFWKCGSVLHWMMAHLGTVVKLISEEMLKWESCRGNLGSDVGWKADGAGQ